MLTHFACPELKYNHDSVNCGGIGFTKLSYSTGYIGLLLILNFVRSNAWNSTGKNFYDFTFDELSAMKLLRQFGAVKHFVTEKNW